MRLIARPCSKLGLAALTALTVLVAPATALASPPSAPTGVAASPATQQAQVSWTAPSSNGGSQITGYTITPYIGAAAQTPTQVGNGSATSATVTGLTNGTGYTFTVKATNADGTSAESSPSAAVAPQDTIFDFSGTPSIVDSGDNHAVELGVKFTADNGGSVTGIRFYKAATNTGTHVGSLYTSDGQLLASATFGTESASGWQTVTFATPVTITAGTTYVAAYYAPNGHYSSSPGGFNGAVDNAPLHALSNTSDSNGVFAYSGTTTFPNNSFNASNYWVDVLFSPAAQGGGSSPPTAPQAVSASPASGQALVSWTAPSSNGGSPVTSYTVTPYIGGTAQTPVQVNNGSATSTKVSGLTNGTTYTFTVTATNVNGTSPESSPSAAVTPQDTIFDFTSSPQNIDSGDGSSVELGTKFTADSSGSVMGIRFYKAATNTGTHIGSLWTSSGTLLASATFTGESATGWQTVTFSSPVAISAGATYVAAYFAPRGHYSATPFGLTNAVDNPPLHAVANSTSVNGVYSYTGASAFPTSTYNANNYWVDVLFAPGSVSTGPPTAPQSVSASPGNTSATVSWSAPSSNGGSPITSYTITPYIGSSAQTPVHINNGSATSGTVTGLTNGTAYTFTVKATNANGDSPESSHSNSVTPATASPPSAPTAVSASPASQQALVSWTAPASNGGSQITGYTITPYIGANAQTPTQVGNGSATSATVTGLTNGTVYTFTVKATNGAGSSPESAASASITPQDTIFDFGSSPQNIDAGDASPVELGTKFTADSSGSITGIRFYKAGANTGTHIGSLWTSSGTLLAQATFTGESATGWQTVTFSSPVAISSGSTYVAAYYAPNGHYSATPFGLTNTVDNPPLHAVANSTSVNGVYSYSGSSTFPSNTYNANNYWVDVLFAPGATNTPPGQPTNVTATARAEGATVSWTAPSSGGAVTNYTVTPYTSGTAQTPVTVSGSSTTTTVPGLIPDESYTFVVQASNAAGSGPASAPSNAVTPTSAGTPSAPQNVSASPATGQALVSWTAPADDGGSSITAYSVTPYIGSNAQNPVQVNNPSATSATVTGLTNGTSYTFKVKAINAAGTGPDSTASGAVTPNFTIFDFAGGPSTVDSGDAQGVELGVKFTADVAGSITGIRFYKASTNTGTHIGSLWTSSGTLLAQATFAGESASGWQTVTFSNPVSITAGTTYVAGYYTPTGHYSVTPAGLNTAVDNAPLHALANSTSANGLFTYSGSSTFPTNTFNANEYWVDVLFSPSASNVAPGQPSNVSASPGYQSATVTWTAPWDGGSPITSYTITPFIGGTAQTPTTITGSPPVTNATVNGLTNGTSYTFRVSATNANGTGANSAASNAVTPGPQPGGQWSSLMNWPIVAIHSMLLKTGKVLTWDGWHQPEPSQEYDPSTGTFSSPINSPDGIFCSAMVPLPDGRMLVVGGYGELSTGNLGIVDTNIYDPTTSTWTRVADMHYPRWYESMTELPDGRYVVVSGKSTDFGTWADTPEVYDPTTNTWTLLSGVNTSQIHELEYPNSYLLPNGNVFVLGPAEDKSFELNVDSQTWTQVGGSSGVVNGGSVMYRPGKVLYAGGAASLASPSQAQANAATIDLTAQTPAWQSIAPMAHARAFNTMQMLADGTVLAVGGESTTGQANGQGEVTGGVLPSEIWDPNTGQWTTVASMAATRGYHTSTLLMPDGRVLVAGSGHAAPGLPGQYNAQYYSPPYLFKGARPTISSAPSSATYGSNITISTPNAASIKSVNLVDLGASTHQMDFNQHFVPLSFTAGSGSLSVQTPASGTWAPPGEYMLFIVDSNGVPSMASFINIGSGGGGASADLGASPALGAPLAVKATATGATTASVSWSAPASGTTGVTGYVVTPFNGSQALPSTTVSGSPAATRASVGGLRPGTKYTFKVRAKGRHGTGPASKSSNAVTPSAGPHPAFVQSDGAYADTIGRLPVKPQSNITKGNRLVVQASVWGGGAIASAVTDSAGNQYTELWRRKAADGTEMSVWTAPITAGGGTRPTITVAPSKTADVGAVVAEYSGLSRASGFAAVDRIVGSGGTTSGAATVSSGAAAPTRGDKELAVGLYADSGFGDALKAGTGFTGRLNISPSTTTMEQLLEDRVLAKGASASSTVRTGMKTPWLMATIVFKTASAPAGASDLNLKTTSPASFTPAQSGASSSTDPVIPLSQRKRPHPIAGGVTSAIGHTADGKIIHFYCLVGPSGKKLRATRTTGATALAWMPQVPAFRGAA